MGSCERERNLSSFFLSLQIVDSERRASSETKSELSRLSRWSDQTVEKKRVTKSHRIYILESGEDILKILEESRGEIVGGCARMRMNDPTQGRE